MLLAGVIKSYFKYIKYGNRKVLLSRLIVRRLKYQSKGILKRGDCWDIPAKPIIK